MKNLKAHHHLAIVSLLVFGVVGIWTWGTVVFASTSGSQVEVWVGPPDSCPNIPGYQTDIPPGMLVDGDGNCYTPPPPPVDICNNIDGMQEIIPSGYYRNDAGDCFVQPTPAVDVCPNIAGNQVTMPTGYLNNIDGDCVLPPQDTCSNIPGSQYLVPEGMQQTDNGTCFTPSATIAPPPPPTEKPVSPWVAPDEPREVAVVNGEPSLKNIPPALSGLVQPFVNAIPETVKEALRSVPPIVAQTFPYYTFAILAAGGAVMGWQSINEVAATRKLNRLLKRERDVAEEKDNFIALASHYLRTPLTIMKGAIDTSIATNEHSDAELAALLKSVNKLDGQINEVLGEVESNTALKSIKAPEKESIEKTNFLRSAFFWTPVIVTVLIVWLANFMLGVVGDVELGTYNLIVQAGIFIAVSMFFYSAIRTRYIKRHEHAYREKLLRHEETIDTARNNFIAQSTLALATGLNSIRQNRSILHSSKAEGFFSEGYSRFDHLLKKFHLLSEIQAGALGATEKFNLRKAVDDIISFYEPQLSAKRITLINNIEQSEISQRRSLFEFVLGSLIDNAIKFSNEGGTITINAVQNEKRLTLKVSDYGEAIPEEKMSQLFKPFSRGTSALEFNYEGLGFSLFLDKIIMDYVGGSITAQSIADKNTTFSVTTPAA